MLNNLSTSQSNPSPASLIPKSEKAINRKIPLAVNTTFQVVPENPNRHYLEIVNLSNVSITLHFGEGTAVLNQGLVMIGRGSTYSITQLNLFTGRIAAISPSAAELAFVECSF